MRKVLIAAGAALIVVGAAALYLIYSLDGIVKEVIENVGSKVAGTKVTVDHVKISLSEGRGTISGLRLANPAGFSGSPAIAFGEITLALDKGSVTGNPVVVTEMQITAPLISYEIGAAGSNLDQLRKNIQVPTQNSGGSTPADKAESKKLVIDRMVISQGQVTLAAVGLPGATAKLGNITLTDIGRGSGGVDAAQVGEQVLSALVNGAIHSAASLPGLLGKAGDQAQSLLPPDAGNALKNLFGK